MINNAPLSATLLARGRQRAAACKVDEPGWEEAQRAERLDDKPPGIGAVKTAQPAPEAAAAFAPTI